MNAQMADGAPEFPNIAVSERDVPGVEGAPDVRVLIYTPKNAAGPLPALLWIHGGGYVLGNVEQGDLNVKAIVSAVGCAAVSVDCRLAPGPAIDDAADERQVARHQHAGRRQRGAGCAEDQHDDADRGQFIGKRGKEVGEP
jgi:acetyl esterase/lipase